jgi:hypothetical protein
MAENTDEEPLDNSPNTQSENPSDEIISTKDTETFTQNQETENMEVHHHTHASHGKKTWKDYFWEFLMLFLAVFCGFLAEWELEHVIEHSREKEFMESMVIDIKTDSSNLANMKSTFGYINIQIDSLLPFLKDNEHLDKNATEIYQHQVVLNFYKKWTYSDRTIDQLKNSGTFRLIRNKAVSDGISQYDGFIRNYINDMQNSLILKQWQGVNDAGNDIFKSSVFREYIKSGNFARHAVVLPNTPYFLTNDKIVLEKLINKIDQYAVSLDWFRMNIDVALQKNKTLDSLIRKEYHLESN